MYYLSNFARPQGAKDKEPRKRRNVLGNLAVGTGVGALGGLGVAKYKTEELTNKTIKSLYSKVFHEEKSPKEIYKLIKENAPKNQRVAEGFKEMMEGKKSLFRGYQKRLIPKGAGLGLIGTGAYLGGKALLNKRNNKSSSPQN